jgi:gamma-glutamyl-gamma-aminobutyrate hydrolase PuuD
VSAPRIGITARTGRGDGRRADVLDRRYVDAVLACGGVPLVLPVVGAEMADRLLDGLDGLLLSGGPDLDAGGAGPAVPRPQPTERDALELALARTAVQRHLPILGVCRGHQVLNVALGGTLSAAVPVGHEIDLRTVEEPPSGHRIHIAAGSLLAAVVGRGDVIVDGMHDRAVRDTGAGLQVVATSADGNVAAVEGLGDVRALGVQWHPERLAEREGGSPLFAWLVREAAAVPSGSVPVIGSGAAPTVVA